VTDNQPPAISCPVGSPFSRNTDAGRCYYTVLGSEFNATFSDNCPGATLINSFNATATLAGAQLPKGTTAITWTATDASGLTSNCLISVIVTDNQPPAISCPVGSPFSRNTDAGRCYYTVLGAEFSPTFSDNCLGTTLINSFNGTATLAGAQLPKGTTVITWTATDASGLTANCSITINVADNQPPAISCPVGSPFIRNTDAGECYYTVFGAEFNATFSDYCPGAILTNSFNGTSTLTNDHLPKGMTVITWTATDASGLISNCSITVNVTDNQAPVITCPAGSPYSRNTDTGQCYYTVSGAEFNATFSDNCPGTIIANNFNGASTLTNAQLPKGTTVITWTATDASGLISTCSISVNVTDNQTPAINCPAGGPFSRDTDIGQCFYTVSGSEFNPAFSDNCPGTTIINSFNGTTTLAGAQFPKGTTVIIWAATDASGLTANCSITINVTDNQPPAISCPVGSPFSRNTDAGRCYYTVLGSEFNATFSDNCLGATLINSFNGTATLTGAQLPKGTTVIIWTATDASDLTANCSITINVTDNQPPAISCPVGSPFSRNTDTGRCYYTVQGAEFNPSFSDNCAGTTAINSFNSTTTLAGAQVPKGSTIINWTAMDAAGNITSCSITVVVIDNQLPTITCPANINRSNTMNSCNTSIIVPNPVIADNCSPAKLTWTMTGATTGSSPVTGINYVGTRAFNVGLTTVNYIVYDEAGNSTACSFIVSVTDNQVPAITCPVGSPFLRGTVPAGCYYITQGSEFDPDFLDNCPGATLHNTFNNTNTLADAHIPVGVNNIVWTVTDAAGLIRTCNVTINIIDDDPPVIVCPLDITVPCPDNIPEPNTGLVTATDNCGSVTVMHVFDNYIGLGNKPGFCPTGVERTYSVTDAAGNSLTCMQFITVAGECGCVICQSAVPHLYANLTGDCDSIWTSASIERAGKCCEASGSDRCISFSVKIDSHAIGFYFLIDGATPPGHYVQVDCGPIMPMSSLICAPPDGEYHTVTFCKPGGNPNVYTIHSVCGLQFPETIFTREDCGKTITISGVVESTVTWMDVTGGGIYNRYLSCDHACLNPVITPDSLSPPIIKYLVCGQVAGNPCSAGGIVCDTVTVHVYPKIQISITPDPPVFCDYSPGTIYATISPADRFAIRWWDAHNGLGNIVSTSDQFTPSAPGYYSITVIDTSSSMPCVYDTLNFEVTIDDCVPNCPTQYHCSENEIITHNSINGFVNAGGQVNFPCTVPDANIWLTNSISDNSACPQIITRSYQIQDFCGNTDVCQEIIAIDDTIPPVINTPDTVYWCVQDIAEANWDGAGDITPMRPDWYTFYHGETSLNIDPSAFSDNCSPRDSLVLHWEITLLGGSVITGSGQISIYPSDIQFPLGESTISYWLEDLCGNMTSAGDRPMVRVIVNPRPDIIRNF